jgi:hypothetical protein
VATIQDAIVDCVHPALATEHRLSRGAVGREGLRLLHRRARERAPAQDYDDFYRGATAPVSDVTAIGEQVAAIANCRS